MVMREITRAGSNDPGRGVGFLPGSPESVKNGLGAGSDPRCLVRLAQTGRVTQ
jgi:hypothetical protein